MVPVRRPHFELRDGSLHFLRSVRPHATLDSVDAALWERIDGSLTVEALERRTSDVVVRLERLWQLGVLELAPPVPDAPRKSVLVIEPHMDDAILSVGGSMLAARGTHDFTLLTLAGRSNFTSYYRSEVDFFDVDRVSSIRRAESELVMRLLGGRHVALELPEAPLRCQAGDWSREWYDRRTKLIDAYLAHAAPRHEVAAWAIAIEGAVASSGAAEIWMPLGVGSHVDHELIRDACIEVMRRRPEIALRSRVFLYPDVPYLIDFPDHQERILEALRFAGAELRPVATKISKVLDEKMRLVSIYGSQFKPSFMRPRVLEAARRSSPDGSALYEVRYELVVTPVSLDPTALYSGRDRIEELAGRLQQWYQAHHDASHVRLLSAEPVPRCHDDLRAIAVAFPGATVEVHVRADHLLDDCGELGPGIRVHPVENGRRGWLARLAALAATRPVPTMIVTGAGLRRWSVVARVLLGRRDVVTADTVNDLVLALERFRR